MLEEILYARHYRALYSQPSYNAVSVYRVVWKPSCKKLCSMETVYRVAGEPRYKKLGIITNHIIRPALYRDQGKTNCKLFLLN